VLLILEIIALNDASKYCKCSDGRPDEGTERVLPIPTANAAVNGTGTLPRHGPRRELG